MVRSPLPPLQAIRVFDAAARRGSFTAAASDLGMTQAAVSYQIKVLEERVGAPLFHRRRRGVELSPAGARMAARIGVALDGIADAFAEARNATGGHLSISVIPTFATHFLAARLGRFQVEHPDLSVCVETSETPVDFVSGDFDVAIRAGKGNWLGLSAHLLVPTVFAPMLSPELARQTALREPRDLLGLPILSQGDPWWAMWLRAAGLEPDERVDGPAQHMGAQVLEANAAMAGQGVAMLTPALFAEELARGRLVQPFALTCDDGTGYWLVYPESHRNSTKIRLFRRWIEAETQSFRE
ncbi:MAG: LysR substrate-binding domain-containing protein [Pseudomonadota bacterium]